MADRIFPFMMATVMGALFQSQIADAAVVLASHYQFVQDERIVQPQVKSRMLLWCKSGNGAVIVNGVACSLQPDDFLFLPWDRSIRYQAASGEPFLVGTIHVIPSHDRSHKVVYGVAHRAQDGMTGWSWRRDVKLPMLTGIQRGSLAHTPALRHLAEYTVQRFASNRCAEWEARCLGQLLLATLCDYFRQEPLAGTNVPPDLQQMILLVRNHVHQKLSLRDLTRFSERSGSYVGRLFRKHLQVSPVAFIIQAKMDHAKHLLSTSRMPIGEVGQRVGIDDPYYFSKLFRKTTGISPLEHRRKSSLL